MPELRRMLPSPNALFVFDAAARNGSFTAAASELNVTQPAVSRMLGQFEEHLGVRLFDRKAGRAVLDSQAWLDLAPRRDNGAPASAYLYTRETVANECSFHARMFVPGNPGYEDPATGSAAAAFAGAVHHFDKPVEGPAQYWIEQGIEMGRPSRIRLELDIEQGRIAAARIGGHAVKFAEGTLFA